MNSLILLRGLLLAIGFLSITCAESVKAAQMDFNRDPKIQPDDNRFTPIVVTQGTLDEPMSFEVLEDGRIFLIERRGGIKVYDPVDASVSAVGYLNVNTEGNKEQGLVGMTVDPNFEENGWMYLYYHHPEDAKGVISRWEIKENTLVANSEIVMLEFPAQRETCCHTGGGMAWNQEGDLYITIGNNTGNNRASHTDERPGRSGWDDQRGASNTDSLEGKILRIHPESDGSYTIPPGNLFPLTMPNTRPEIYTMGHRNPWRVSIDSETGWIYWGEVGPDANEDSEIGPMGYDEFNQARQPGFFGWPYFVGDFAYPLMDYETNIPGEKKDPRNPTNLSPNNTGLVELPPLQPSFVYYPYGHSDLFPAMNTSGGSRQGRSATGGPIYRRADRPNALRAWPAYFEGKWIAAEFSRRALFLISMEENGDFKSVERFLPDYQPVEPIDAKFGPNGDLYVLEYGGRWFSSSPEAKLVRIAYEGGNRQPIVMAKSDKIGGIPPFEVSLSSEGTEDYDFDELQYRWEIADAGGNVEVIEQPNPIVTLTSIGTYNARLTVTDPAGATDSVSLPIVSGNEPPKVSIHFEGNQSYFFPGKPIKYAVEVEDAEDGALSKGEIEHDNVVFSIDFVDSTFDLNTLPETPDGDPVAARFPVAQTLIAKGNCRSCHAVDKPLVGPSFTMIAERYLGDESALDTLSQKVVSGGRGVWGETPMPPNGLLSESEASQILKYVLSLTNDSSSGFDLVGSYVPDVRKLPQGRGSGRRGTVDPGAVLMRAIYEDEGDDFAAPLTVRTIKFLKPARFQMTAADELSGIQAERFGAQVSHNGYAIFKNLDLTQVKQLDVRAFVSARSNHLGGTIEVRLGDSQGDLLGTGSLEAPEPQQGGGRRQFNRDPVHIAIREAPGFHDLCLVFINNDVAEGASLMSVSSIEFQAELSDNE